MGELTVYSFKVDKEQLDHAKRFFERQGTPLQHSMRDLIGVAADCEKCLELHEEDASLSELQSAFATLLANCKATWYLNSLIREAVMKIAKISKVPLDYISNVLGEAQRVKPAVRRI
ncbi:MAG TPA: hypothetical protein G4N90_00190 [Dehalococcoidia bacterium]|jgi:hypothetical protein|nr:hypothetical protein [Dehalococcoidia bacterium]